MVVNLANALLASALSSVPYIPSSACIEEKIEGFTVLISPEVAARSAQRQDLRAELEMQLLEISGLLPSSALEKLRKTRIWVEWKAKGGSAAEFHSSRVWLSANRYNPEKFNAVEINNVENFLAWSRQEHGSILLHELAHSYFAALPEYDRLLVDMAYSSALDTGRYDSVSYHDGSLVRAYALTDSSEYFAELTEAYFGLNDFYPFVRADISDHDPDGYAIMLRSWGEDP